MGRKHKDNQNMIHVDDALMQDYLAGTGEHLTGIETDLLALEIEGAEIDRQRVDRVLRGQLVAPRIDSSAQSYRPPRFAAKMRHNSIRVPCVFFWCC